jgi:hypothetical protein
MTRTTSPRDPDAILAAWLEEGPNQLPETTRRAIAVGLRSTRQTRALRVPKRPNAMNPFVRFAVAAAAIVIAAGGALYLLVPRNQTVVGPSPAPSPSAAVPSPSAAAPSASASAQANVPPSQPLAWETFAPRSYPLRIEVPAGWVRSIPVDDRPGNLFPGEQAQFADRWDQPVLGTPYLVVSTFSPAPESIDAWLERNVTRLVAECDAGDPIEISIAGTTGERRTAYCSPGVATEIVIFVIADHPITIESSALSADAATAAQILDHVIETATINSP